MKNNAIFSAVMNTMPFGNMQNFMQQFNNFKRTFGGDPHQAVQKMLNEGKITQSQVDQAKQMADQIKSMMR